ncbi:MAG: hypothetical protein ACRDJV_13885 [Actinomycetota bacterium]
MGKRKKLLRVVIAAALLVVAVPSAAWAYPLKDGGGQAGARTEKAGCSLDPRLLRMEPQLCSDNQVTTDQGSLTIDQDDPLARGRAADSARWQAQADAAAPAPSDSTDIRPASSDGTEIAIGWWMVSIAVAAGGVAGLIAGLRRGRPHALS